MTLATQQLLPHPTGQEVRPPPLPPPRPMSLEEPISVSNTQVRRGKPALPHLPLLWLEQTAQRPRYSVPSDRLQLTTCSTEAPFRRMMASEKSGLSAGRWRHVNQSLPVLDWASLQQGPGCRDPFQFPGPLLVPCYPTHLQHGTLCYATCHSLQNPERSHWNRWSGRTGRGRGCRSLGGKLQLFLACKGRMIPTSCPKLR